MDKHAVLTHAVDKQLFFKAWDIFQAHWGKEEQALLRVRCSARLLAQQLRNSAKMRALSSMLDMLRSMMWFDFMDLDDIFDSVRNMAEACLEEEWNEEQWWNTAPFFRMQHHLHKPVGISSPSIYQREWLHLGGPRMKQFFGTDESIYRVSALVALL